MHRPGAPAEVVLGAGDDGVDVAGAEDAGAGVVADGLADALACPLPEGDAVVWDCGWLAPHAVSNSAAAAAAVVITSPWGIF
ncbi:hypothetical protein [Pseudarthrobacter defluvii]|uniref:hypothetical protein n=1 Tax=Pseudarthrobacter defluvii TaxID=410837 RepID=UPI0027D8D649|nr:hypothetical protein [Pseudarthrobacter defluvii]